MRRVALFVLLLVGCRDKAKDEAKTLAMVIDRYREASLEERPARGERVAMQPCSHPVTCATKEACLRSIAPLLDALALKARAGTEAEKLSDGGGTAADFDAIDKLLVQASDKVKEAERFREGCEEALRTQKQTFEY